MVPQQSLGSVFRDEQCRTAIALGLASVPFTVAVNWLLVADPRDATPLFVACVVSGYLSAGDRGGRAGAITGAVGGIPLAVWQGAAVLGSWPGNPLLVDAVGRSWLGIAIPAVAASITVLVVLALLSAVGWVGGLVGRWANERVETWRARGSEA